MAVARTLCLVALVSALALLAGAACEQAQSEICGAAATTFDLCVTDGDGAAINDSNKAERTEILTFSWTICPDAQVTDRFGNKRFGDYAFQRGISDQPTGGFNWIVSSQGDTRTYWVPIDLAPPPPPPPPPLPRLHPLPHHLRPRRRTTRRTGTAATSSRAEERQPLSIADARKTMAY